MNTTYCGKDCTNCTYKDKLRCPGCADYTGALSGQCPLADCCLEKQLDRCDTCSSKENCFRLKDLEKVPQDRLTQLEKAANEREQRLQDTHFLGKWLWILFLLVIPASIGGFMTLDFVTAYLPYLATPGMILQQASTFAYGIILLKLGAANERYRNAGICSIISAAVLIIVNVLSRDILYASWMTPVLLVTAVISLVGVYNQMTAHSQVCEKAGSPLSGKWQKLWVWYIAVYLTLLIGSLILIWFGIVGLILILAISIILMVVSIMQLVYLYKTAKLFKNMSEI